MFGAGNIVRNDNRVEQAVRAQIPDERLLRAYGRGIVCDFSLIQNPHPMMFINLVARTDCDPNIPGVFHSQLEKPPVWACRPPSQWYLA